MSERERPGSGSGDYEKKSEKLRHKVDIHGKSAGEFSANKGSTLADVISEVKRSVKMGDLSQYTSVRVNDKDIAVKDGVLSENPVLTENSTIMFLRGEIAGGCQQSS